MGRTKSRANGDGDVFPRKNKAGKITSYRGATSGPTGNDATCRARPKRRRASRAGGLFRRGPGPRFDAARLTVAEYLYRW